MKKSKECLICGVRLLPSRWKIKYCEKHEKEAKIKHEKIMDKMLKKHFKKE